MLCSSERGIARTVDEVESSMKGVEGEAQGRDVSLVELQA
jgi:hypothetical protein